MSVYRPALRLRRHFPWFTGGDPDLQAEKSKQCNFGVVWEPVPGFSVDVDYWKINKTTTMGALTDDRSSANFDLFEDTHFMRGPVDAVFPTLPGPIRPGLRDQ